MKMYFLCSQICKNILDVKFGSTIWAKRCHSSQTLYDLLKISPSASQSQIKAAYFRLSKKYHPDVNKEADARHVFNRIAEAYKVLSNTGQRAEYDRQISNNTQRSSFASSSTIHREDTFREARTTKVKSNTGQYHTGKTPHFDFDEFYRNHYPEMVKQAREAKIKRDAYERDVKLQQKTMNARVGIQLILIILILLAMLF